MVYYRYAVHHVQCKRFFLNRFCIVNVHRTNKTELSKLNYQNIFKFRLVGTHLAQIKDSGQTRRMARPMILSLSWAQILFGLSNIYPFKPNGISHRYQLDNSVFNFSGVGWYFSYFSKQLNIL